MNFNDINEIGIIHNAKVNDTHSNQIEKRDLLVFILSDNTTHYLDISAGKELEEYENVLANNKTKIEKIYKSRNVNLEEFKASHPDLDIKLEDGILKAKKIVKKEQFD